MTDKERDAAHAALTAYLATLADATWKMPFYEAQIRAMADALKAAKTAE